MFIEENGNLVSQIPSARRSVAFGRGLAGGAAGQPLQFSIVSISEDGRRLTSGGAQIGLFLAGNAVSSSSNASFKWSSEDTGDGSYVVTYSCVEPGNFALHVRIGGEEVAGSPWNVRISPGVPVAAKSELMLDKSQGIFSIGSHSLAVRTRDALGNFSYDRTAVLGARGGGGVKILSVADFQDSKFVVHFDVCGNGRIDVLLNGSNIQGSPVQVTLPEIEGTRIESRKREEEEALERELRVREKEDELETAMHRLRAIQKAAEQKMAGRGADKIPSVPPVWPAEPSRQNSAAGSRKEERTTGTDEQVVSDPRVLVLQEKIAEMQHKFASVQAKERELDRLIVQVNNEKLREQESIGGRILRSDLPLATAPEVSLSAVTSNALHENRSAYFRRDMYVSDKQAELRKLLARRKKEEEAGIEPGLDVAEAMRRTSFLRAGRLAARNRLDAESKVLFTIDWLFAHFATAVADGAPAFSLSDAVRLSAAAHLPLDDAEVVEAYVSFIRGLGLESSEGIAYSPQFVSKRNFFSFISGVSGLVVRDSCSEEEKIAKCFEEHWFALAGLQLNGGVDQKPPTARMASAKDVYSSILRSYRKASQGGKQTGT